MNKIPNVLIITLDHGLRIPWIPLGMAYIASSIRTALDDVHISIWNQDINHYPDNDITKILNNNNFDFVLLSTMAGAIPYRKVLSLCDAINKSRNRDSFKLQLGGHAATADPEYYLKNTKADCICMGEGDITTPEWMKCVLENGNLEKIPGISYSSSGECYVNSPRKLISNLNSLEFPAYDLLDMSVYRLKRYKGMDNTEFSGQMLSGRGCNHNCNFCYRIDRGLRVRSPRNIMNEIRMLNEKFGITYIAFNDELLMTSEKRVFDLCNEFKNSDLKFKWWCNGHLSCASKDVLEVMKDVGCQYINYGIESLDDHTREIMRKGISHDEIVGGIERTIKAGITPGINILYGNIQEPLSAIDKAVDFLLKYNDEYELKTIRPVTPYPGTDLFDYAIKTGAIKTKEDFYKRQCANSDLLNVNVTGHDLRDINIKLYESNSILIRKYAADLCKRYESECKSLYIDGNENFRGYV